jgi:hypothetical protein
MVVELCAGWVVGKSEHVQRREGGRKKGRVVHGGFVLSDICVA